MAYKGDGGRKRTDAQLERKRARDREMQRRNRELGKENMNNLQAELAKLRREVATISSFIKTGRDSSSLTPGDMNDLSLETSSPGFLAQNPSSIHDITTGTVEEHYASPLTTSRLSVTSHACSVERDATLAISNLPSPPLGYSDAGSSDTRFHQNTRTYQAHQPNNTVGFSCSNVEVLETPRVYTSWAQNNLAGDETLQREHTPDLSKCKGCASCTEDSASNHECLDQYTFKLLWETHRAISRGDPHTVQQCPRSPSVANLLFIDTDSNPVVKVISQILQPLTPRTLSCTIATYYIIYRLLRWRIYPIPETLEDVPSWYRPSHLQQRTPHSIYIDLLAWPALRDHLIEDQTSVEPLAFAKDIPEAINVNWPDDRTVLVMCPHERKPILDPRFVEHIWEYSNWKLSSSWAKKYHWLAHHVNLAT